MTSELAIWKVVWIVLAVVGTIAILGGLGMLAVHRQHARQLGVPPTD